VVWSPTLPSNNIGIAFNCTQKREERLRDGTAGKPFQTANGGLGVAANFKITIYARTYDLYGPVRNVFDSGRYIPWASGRELGPGNGEFFGTCEMASSDRRVPFGAQKTRYCTAPPPPPTCSAVK
jgi:hypothetical protein